MPTKQTDIQPEQPEQNKEELPPINEWIQGINFKTTEEIKVPESLLDQVIGQDQSVAIVKKAAEQKRHVMLIGDPGTGKSMVARAMTEFLPKGELEDIIVYPNNEDTNTPTIRVVPAGKAHEIIKMQREEAKRKVEQQNSMILGIVLLIVTLSLIGAMVTQHFEYAIFGVIAAVMVYLIVARGGFSQRRELQQVPKVLVAHEKLDMPPFIDATAAHSGALLGDVRHDPFQSAGLETPPHQLVEAGAIHRAHKGVLYIDEINTLSLPSQQHLLTAIQEKKFQITGQSERSFGAMVKTEPVPCDFILVSAGNLDALKGMHPALRSRVKGYGYEVYMSDTIEDTPDNRQKLVRFVAQEVVRDGKIPHFDRSAVEEILREARRSAGRKGHLTLKLRDLGGLVRVAGDIAHGENAPLTTAAHVLKAKSIARSVEQQVAYQYLERRKDYKLFVQEGAQIGRVNGLAVMGDDSGIVLP